ncbi:hypothetical protein BDU57DRAFT_525388 [Ampelomyces quisqualis]|uniref:Uncharacterized protein n=1 Tax=Ampelomyces quisqualis TaxID=50730 RepID=A0A6A5QZM5_AMPQU|nr:hypothetical protein BDU57DRAFT_525388 [Ampelomyces quisqualis]
MENTKTVAKTNIHSILVILLAITLLASTSPAPIVGIPSALTSFPTTITKSRWTSYLTSTQYPNPGLPLFAEQQWVDAAIAAVYEPWLSAPTSFPYTMVKISETTAKTEPRTASQWNQAASRMSVLSQVWTVRATVILRS